MIKCPHCGTKQEFAPVVEINKDNPATFDMVCSQAPDCCLDLAKDGVLESSIEVKSHDESFTTSAVMNFYPKVNEFIHNTLHSSNPIHDSFYNLPIGKEDHKPAKFPKKRGGMDLNQFRECVNKGKL